MRGGCYGEFFGVPAFSRPAAYLLDSRRAGQRNDRVAVAAFGVWRDLDWVTVLFQFGADTGDESLRSKIAGEDLSGVDAASDGMVSLVGAGYGVGGSAVFLHLFGAGRAECGAASGISLARGMAGGLARCLRFAVCLAVPGQGDFSRSRLGARGWNCGGGDSSVLADLAPA